MTLTGSASYSIDLPNGGNATIRGNVIQQGPASQNAAIIHFGGEGIPYSASSLWVIDNTILNDLNRSSASAVLNQTATRIGFSNNKVYGLSGAQMVNGPGTQTGTTILTSEPGYSTTPPYVANDTLVLTLSETGASMAFIATLDGKAIPGSTVLNTNVGGALQSFTFHAAAGAGLHTVAIEALNLSGASTGQLFVNGLSFDGIAINGAAGALAPHQSALFTVGHA